MRYLYLLLTLLLLSCTESTPSYYPSKEIQTAIEEVCKIYGPQYQYRLWSDGKLEVNRGDGKWQTLKY